MIKTINKIRSDVMAKSPLIHAITNPISITQCANTVLAVGGRPIMAEHPGETAEITKSARALLLNLGNITDVRMKSMLVSAKTANKNNIPVVLDLVGIACSRLRRNFALKLMKTSAPTLIKGNYSEICAIYDKNYKDSGVDACGAPDVHRLDKIAEYLSKRFGAVVLASGKTDIICDGDILVHINGGTSQLSKITGTGCMLGALAACFMSARADIYAAAAACAVLKISGEKSACETALGSFLIKLIDSISAFSDGDLENYLKAEVKKI